jgi:predicted GIY-YIG superfamily endonuclease
MSEHEQALIEGFSKRYGVKLLVYYEYHDSMDEAIRREKQLKEWKRAWKVRLLESMNPEWVNLFDPATCEVWQALRIAHEKTADGALVETCVDPGLRRDDGMGGEASRMRDRRPSREPSAAGGGCGAARGPIVRQRRLPVCTGPQHPSAARPSRPDNESNQDCTQWMQLLETRSVSMIAVRSKA